MIMQAETMKNGFNRKHFFLLLKILMVSITNAQGNRILKLIFSWYAVL